ncbi:transcriptional regulator [Rhizobium sp. CF142]|nr:transcriptional regulator [Rhizobium sp. CF142]
MAPPKKTDEERNHSPHRTIDRVARLIEEIVYRPGMTFGELLKVTDLPKSTLHGFVEGLLANGWLYGQRDGSQHRLHLGPAVYGLILSSGKVRAGSVSNGDLYELHAKVDAEVYLGVLVGHQLVYVAEAGADPVAGFHPRNVIRRELLRSAGGKALLASQPQTWIENFLRARPSESDDLIRDFLAEARDIRATGVAHNFTQNGTRFALASVLRDSGGKPVASVTVVGPADSLVARREEIAKELLQYIARWERRETEAREAI